MAYATIYKDTDYQGVFARLGPGYFRGSLYCDTPGALCGYPYQSTQGEPLDNEISSIRVGPNTIVALYDSHAMTASSPARVIVGPTDIPDLTAIGMADIVSTLLVLPFREYPSGIPRPGGVRVSTGYNVEFGKYADLGRGDYDEAQLIGSQETNRIGTNAINSIRVDSHVVAILYDGPSFDTTMDAIVVVGPTQIDDLGRVGFDSRTSSIRVLYTDPGDIPRLPGGPLGATRGATPGGGSQGGHWGGWNRWGLGGGFGALPPEGASRLSGLHPGAQDLILPRIGNDSPYGPNWAGEPTERHYLQPEPTKPPKPELAVLAAPTTTPTEPAAPAALVALGSGGAAAAQGNGRAIQYLLVFVFIVVIAMVVYFMAAASAKKRRHLRAPVTGGDVGSTEEEVEDITRQIVPRDSYS